MRSAVLCITTIQRTTMIATRFTQGPQQPVTFYSIACCYANNPCLAVYSIATIGT